MNAKKIETDIKQFVGGGFITRQQLARYMGRRDPHSVDRYLVDLERVNGKYYFIPDVAETLIGGNHE